MKTRFLSFITALSIMLTSTLMFPQINVFAYAGESVLSLNDSTVNSKSAGKIKFKQISIGENHSAAITTNGDLYMWGSGYLGNGTETNSAVPIKIMSDVSYVSLGYMHSAAITTNGELYTWGYNHYGELGNGTKSNSNIPIKIMNNVFSVSLGDYCSAAITKSGDLYMWGWNDRGQLGNGTETDSTVPIKIMNNIASVSVSGMNSAAITTSGDLYMWGWNAYGQFGNGTNTNSDIPIKIMSNVMSVSISSIDSAAITTNGDLFMWGRNNHGQHGNGTTTSSNVPIKIMNNIASVSLGGVSSAAITTSGDLYTWGFGYLGDGAGTDRYVPLKIMNNVASVSIAGLNNAAITTDGDLYMWGMNNYGQIGNGTTEVSNVPIKIEIPYKTEGEENDFVGEATNNIGTRDVLCGDFLSVDFSNIISPLYPTSFDSYEVISSNPSVAEIVNTYDYTNGAEPLRYVSSEICTKNEGIANIICKFSNAVVGNKKLKEYTLIYTVNASNAIFSKDVSLEAWSETLGNKKISINFSYSDDLFAGDSTDYNYELSKLSSIMAMSAYWDRNKDNRYVSENLEKLGFDKDSITDCESYAKLKNMTESDCHYVGYTFATKDIYIGDQKNTVVAVIIKGTSKNEEWYSNFDVYEHENLPSNRHFGFAFANAKMEKDFNEYISKLNIDYSNTKIWITGHSRGAGVGNLFAADIIAEGKFLQSNVFAYLYAPPAVEKNINIKYENIFNFINPQDFVPRMPLQSWNYKRYGNDYIFPNKVTNDFNMWVEYENEIRRVFYDLFGGSVKPYFFNNGTGNTIDLCNLLYSKCRDLNAYYKKEKVITELPVNGNPSIQNEYSFYEYFRYGIAAAAASGKINTILKYDFQPYLTITGYFVGGTKGLNSNTIDSLISGSGLYRPVVYSHTPEMYIAWAYVCDSLNDFKHNFFIEGIIACPVDIEVYDSHNNLVGRVVNNKVDESVTKLEILVDEETSTKTVFMPASEQFTVKALGYDNGTMDYSIELCDITDLSTSDLRSIDDIEITPNTTVTTNTDLSGNVTIVAVTDNGDNVKTVEYTIDENNIVTTKTTTTDNNTPSFPNDSDNNHYTPSNPPSGGSSNVTPPASSSDVESFNVKVENKVTGETKNIRAVRNGENVTVAIGKENNGYYANIYTNNGDFIVAVRIEKGEVKFFIPKDVKFNIIIDEYSYGEDVSSGAGANDSGSPIDMASPITNGVRIPQAEFPRGFRISNKKRKYRILRKRRLDDLVFVF